MKIDKFFKVLNVATVLIAVSGQNSNEEDFFKALSQLGASLNGNSVPYNASKSIVPALENLAQQTDSLSSFQSIEWDQSVGQTWYDTYMSQLSDADTRTFGDVDRTLIQLYNDNQQCYEIFTKSIAEIYIGFMKFFDKFRGSSELSTYEQINTFEDFCHNESNFLDYIEELTNYLLGEGDCDVLQALYEGDVSANIWQGWRDNIDDKAGYLIMYLSEGIITANACQNIFINEEGYDASSEENQSRQERLVQINQQLSQVIRRTLDYDQKALTSVEETVQTNLRKLLQEFQGLSLEVMALNVNYYQLSTMYNDYVWKMAAAYSNISEEDYYVECWDCVKITEGDFSVIVDWLPVDSTASIPQDALDQIEYTEGMSNEELAAQIWEKLGDCVSGVSWVKNDVPFYLSVLIGDRLVVRVLDNISILVWGVQEICNGRPPAPLT
eukprot:403369094